MRSQSSFLSSWGTVLVTTIFLSLLPLRASMAFPLRIPCVTMASASLAPSEISTSAALTSVPQVSAMSSTKIAVLPRTSPTSTIRETSLGRVRSLWMRANPRFKPSAIEVALPLVSTAIHWSLTGGERRGCSSRPHDAVACWCITQHPCKMARLGGLHDGVLETFDANIRRILPLCAACIWTDNDTVLDV